MSPLPINPPEEQLSKHNVADIFAALINISFPLFSHCLHQLTWIWQLNRSVGTWTANHIWASPSSTWEKTTVCNCLCSNRYCWSVSTTAKQNLFSFLQGSHQLNWIPQLTRSVWPWTMVHATASPPSTWGTTASAPSVTTPRPKPDWSWWETMFWTSSHKPLITTRLVKRYQFWLK